MKRRFHTYGQKTSATTAFVSPHLSHTCSAEGSGQVLESLHFIFGPWRRS